MSTINRSASYNREYDNEDGYSDRSAVRDERSTSHSPIRRKNMFKLSEGQNLLNLKRPSTSIDK